MLNTVVEMDQADGLRQLMLNRSKRYISVSIPGSDFDRHKVFGLVRQAMNLRDVDEVSEALLTDRSPRLTVLLKLYERTRIICLSGYLFWRIIRTNQLRFFRIYDKWRLPTWMLKST